MSDQDFKALLSKENYKKYEEFLVTRIIEKSHFHEFCPGKPSTFCDKVIKLHYPFEKLGFLNVHCCCGHNFCLKCRDIPHRPLSCNNLKRWKILNSEEDIT